MLSVILTVYGVHRPLTHKDRLEGLSVCQLLCLHYLPSSYPAPLGLLAAINRPTDSADTPVLLRVVLKIYAPRWLWKMTHSYQSSVIVHLH